MKDLYRTAYEARNSDSTRFWTMFGVMTTVNGGLLAFVSSHIQDRIFAVLVGLVGLVVCILWFSMQRRYAWWCEHWDEQLKAFEPLVKEEINYQRNKKHLTPIPDALGLFRDPEKPRACGLSTRIGPCFMAAAFFFAWLVVIGFALVQ